MNSSKNENILYLPINLEKGKIQAKTYVMENPSDNFFKNEKTNIVQKSFCEESKIDHLKNVNEKERDIKAKNFGLKPNTKIENQSSIIQNIIVSQALDDKKKYDFRKKDEEYEQKIEDERNGQRILNKISHNGSSKYEEDHVQKFVNNSKCKNQLKMIVSESEKSIINKDLLNSKQEFDFPNKHKANNNGDLEINFIPNFKVNSQSNSPKISTTNINQFDPKLGPIQLKESKHKEQDLEFIIGNIKNLKLVPQKEYPYNLDDKMNINQGKNLEKESKKELHDFINKNDFRILNKKTDKDNHQYHSKILQMFENQQLNRIGISSAFYN